MSQRRIQTNGLNDPTTVSLVVDAVTRANLPTRSPGKSRAWPGDSDMRQRSVSRQDDNVRLSPAAYSVDVSHLIV